LLFNSLAYAVFLPIVFGLYWGLDALLGRGAAGTPAQSQRAVRAQNLLLVLASYLFYGWWDWRFLGLLWLSTAVDFLVGRALGVPGRPEPLRKRIMLISVVFNLGLLGTFKYFNFFADSLRAALHGLGVEAQLGTLDVILPVGISFYTFQSLGYIIDVHRRVIPPAASALDFAAFVSFFPQLVAGPISRADLLLGQFPRRRVFRTAVAADALRQILWGLTKKVLVADNLASTVEHVFRSGAALDGLTIWTGVGLFTMQLYCDFSGYSDMATGSARLLGFDLARNFDHPFFSRSLGEFWRRWHISFNSWMRDFVYVPLETATRRRFIGRRKARQQAGLPAPPGPPRWESAFNIVLVFTLSGLWHGAAWTYVSWGFINGVFLIASALRRPPMETGVVAFDRHLPTARELLAMARTNALIVFTLLFFRAPDLGTALSMLGRSITTPFDPAEAATHAALLWPLALALLPLVVDWLTRTREHGLAAVPRLPVAARWATYCAAWLAILVLGSMQSRDFVYFQF